MVLHGGYDSRRDKAWTHAEFLIRKGQCWSRFLKRVEEVAYTEREIRQRLSKAGYDAIQSRDETPFVRGEFDLGPGFRTIYLAQKTNQ